MQNIVVFGATGSIGSAIVDRLKSLYPAANIAAVSQQKPDLEQAGVRYHQIEYANEQSIADLASRFNNDLDLVFVATGILHSDGLCPEKSLKQISTAAFEKIFSANTIFPAMVAKHFIPKLNQKSKSIFTSISARVGSISDNRLGGWYAYRVSKAALNMFIKTASIETSRTNKNAIIVGLHPGTVDSKLSKPFQARVPEGKLFTPIYSAERLIDVLASIDTADSGKCFAWDGQEIQP